jgi:hypothetical protein
MTQVTTVKPPGTFGLMTREQLGKATNRCDETIRRWEKRGLPVYRLGNLRLYDPEKIAAFLRGDLELPTPGGPGRPRKTAG